MSKNNEYNGLEFFMFEILRDWCIYMIYIIKKNNDIYNYCLLKFFIIYK